MTKASKTGLMQDCKSSANTSTEFELIINHGQARDHLTAEIDGLLT
jgi:hypothetical protein